MELVNREGTMIVKRGWDIVVRGIAEIDENMVKDVNNT